jgi:Tol biopolymer transport system component
MHARWLFVILIFVLLAGCSAPQPQATQPAQPAPATQAPAQPQAQPPAESPAAPQPYPPAGPGEQPPYPAPGETPGSQPETPAAAGWVAFVGRDENLWLVNPSTLEMRQITDNAMPYQMGVEGPTRRYDQPRWSSDGRFLAFVQEYAEPVASGMEYSFSLLLYDLSTGALRILLQDRQLAGYDWRPGTHQLAFAVPVLNEYWAGRGAPASEHARGIYALDVQSGAMNELVPPLAGIHLAMPHFSPDGRFLAFDEISQMEGRGTFAYFDFEAGEYVRWERTIGSYDWAPGSERLAYDYLSYMPQGGERIRLNDRRDSSEMTFSPELPGSAQRPVFSPDGAHLVYVLGEGEFDDARYSLLRQPLSGGEPTNLGAFEQPLFLTWTEGGTRLVFSSGPFGVRDILELNMTDGSLRTLAQGEAPAVQPVR